MNLPAESFRDVCKCLDSRSLVAIKLTNSDLRDFVSENSAVLAIIRQSRCRLFFHEKRDIFFMLDQVSLASCSLVCHEWMQVTRQMGG